MIANEMSEERVIEIVQSFLRQFKVEAKTIPDGIKKILKEGLWKYRDPAPAKLKAKEFENFKDFVEYSTPFGLNVDFNFIKKFCEDDNEALSLLDENIKIKTGNPNGIRKRVEDGTIKASIPIRNNVTNRDYKDENKRRVAVGNTKQAGLRRLRKSRPDLHESVIKNEITVNAAMIEAGFRTKKYQIELIPEKLVDFIKDKFDEKDRQFIADNIM